MGIASPLRRSWLPEPSKRPRGDFGTGLKGREIKDGSNSSSGQGPLLYEEAAVSLSRNFLRHSVLQK